MPNVLVGMEDLGQGLEAVTQSLWLESSLSDISRLTHSVSFKTQSMTGVKSQHKWETSTEALYAIFQLCMAQIAMLDVSRTTAQF